MFRKIDMLKFSRDHLRNVFFIIFIVIPTGGQLSPNLSILLIKTKFQTKSLKSKREYLGNE